MLAKCFPFTPQNTSFNEKCDCPFLNAYNNNIPYLSTAPYKTYLPTKVSPPFFRDKEVETKRE